MCFRCRRTALHLASLNGHTKVAVALLKAGADVNCKANDGYGSRGCFLASLG
jgi:ankyrin repeat protein